jgi:plastocyanin
MRHFALGSVLLLASAPLTLAKTIEVIVGGTQLKFDPPAVNASLNDIVRFVFHQKNHTVTQSSLEKPCSPLPSGFDTNFTMFVPENQTNNFPTALLTVDKTTPIWAYCRQGAHCTSGMVFAINANPSQLAAFQAAATGGTRPPSVSSTTAPAPTSSGIPSSTDHKVIVGGSNNTFQPDRIDAKVGDTITFEFHQKNHTVSASTFENPCLYETGFDSGFKPVPEGAVNFPTYVVQVNDTNTIWAFCKQGNHCSKGMVFAANTVESSDKTFAAFQDRAKNPSSTTTPGGYPSSAWRPTVGSSSIAVVLSLFAVALLL